jgi:hypothetical protein
MDEHWQPYFGCTKGYNRDKNTVVRVNHPGPLLSKIVARCQDHVRSLCRQDGGRFFLNREGVAEGANNQVQWVLRWKLPRSSPILNEKRLSRLLPELRKVRGTGFRTTTFDPKSVDALVQCAIDIDPKYSLADRRAALICAGFSEVADMPDSKVLPYARELAKQRGLAVQASANS